ncbi:MAG TPA: carboxylating nicotinate-nucleotide diphosphorylase [Methanomassiliicoccales archaeon]|nr:carboxylating nicotinate-nucleotide diphosphorylase [Methanomassiliicoccales archaeon]
MNRIKDFLAEDEGDGDITSNLLIGPEEGSAHITSNEACVLAGLEEAQEVFHLLGVRAEAKAKDGDILVEGQEILVLHGTLRKILLGERLALNFLMRMSGIATVTRAMVDACKARNPNVRIASTRKTTPGFRRYEKKAVKLGGGDPHRFRLDDGILIKDNHLSVVGSIGEAVGKAKSYSFSRKVEVEVEDLEGAREAAHAGADIIMLDNMSLQEAEAAFSEVKRIDRRILVEASGGMTPQSAPDYAPFADIISMGWITHSARAVQFSLHLIKDERA